MAITSALSEEGMFGNRRCKIYKLTLDTSSTSIAITPGAGYCDPVGAYSYYTLSSGTYTFTTVAAGGTKYSYIIFFSPGSGS